MLSAITPLMIGFFSGFHCIAMCGGLCAAICHQNNPSQVLLTNLGRVFTYTFLGALFAGLVQGASLQLELDVWGLFLRMLMGVMMVLTGVAILLKDKGKWLVVQKPLPFWPQIAKILKQIQRSKQPGLVLLKGMLWGLIPCGLLYGMLIIAATTADVLRGASFMLFFGLGTIIPLFVTQVMMNKILARGHGAWLRNISATFIILLGLWILLSPWFSHQLIPEDNVFFTELAAVLSMCMP